jgi:MinD-like ATPase involved in chromosome partitioning or flagellar assembly
MKYIDLLAMVELAKLKVQDPEEYRTIISSIKEVIKDIKKLELEIIEEIETEIQEKKKKEKYELDLTIAEKMKGDKPRV